MSAGRGIQRALRGEPGRRRSPAFWGAAARAWAAGWLAAGLWGVRGPCPAFAAATAGASLNLSQDARSEPLGPGFAALADTAGAMRINPAGLARLRRPEFSAFYSSHLMDSRQGFLSFAYPGTAVGSLGVGFFDFSAGGFDGRDASGRATGRFLAEDRVWQLSWAGALPRWFEAGAESSFGLSGKVFESRIADVSARTYAMDAGVLHKFGRLPVSVAAAVRNIGPGIRYRAQTEPLPLSVTGAVASAPAAFPVTFVAGVSRGVRDSRTDINAGMEAAVASLLSLRVSFRVSDPGSFGGNSAGLTSGVIGGFGLRFADYQVDASINPGELGTVAGFSVTARFGGRVDEASFDGGNPELRNTRINRKKRAAEQDPSDDWLIFR